MPYVRRRRYSTRNTTKRTKSSYAKRSYNRRSYYKQKPQVKWSIKGGQPGIVPNQTFRVVLPLTQKGMINTTASESTAAQTGCAAGAGVNMWGTIFGSTLFNSQVANRFSSIKVKGYSINRTIFYLDLSIAQSADIAPDWTSNRIVYRFDSDAPRASENGFSVTDMLSIRDTKYKIVCGGNSGQKSIEIFAKVFARKDQLYVTETASDFGQSPNAEYFNAQFQMGMEGPGAAGILVQLIYRDIVEVLYDGYERKY